MSICDKNNPPERSDKELDLARQEQERIESLITGETLGEEAPVPVIPAAVQTDTNEFNRLSNIQNSINKISGGKELSVNKISAVERQVQFDGVAVDIDELIRIANIQNTVLNVTSGASNISFRNPSSKSDCDKNINDLLISQLKKIIMNLIRDADNADQLVAINNSLRSLELEISNIFAIIEKAQGKSFLELMVLAKNAGFLERIGIIRDISKKFSGVVSNLNGILANIESFDVCNAFDYNTAGSLLPKALKIDPEPAPAHPDPCKGAIINSDAQELTAAMIDHRLRAGDLINGVYTNADLTEDESYGSMLTSLNSLYYGYKTEVIVEGTDEFREKADVEIQRLINNNRNEWSGDILNEFKKRATLLSNLVVNDADIIQNDHIRNSV